MAGVTPHFGLLTLRPGEQMSMNDGKFLDEDRRIIDAALRVGASTHRHTGAPGSGNPVLPPSLVLSATGGAIPAGVRAYYQYTHVDASGAESLPSPIAYVDTPPPIVEPAAPVLSWSDVGGLLLPGAYYYVVSAYAPTPTQETKAINFANIQVPYGTTNRVTLTLPSLPPGAVGFNIYRRKPGSLGYFFLASTTAPTWTDDGSTAEDCGRILPVANTTRSANKVTVALPGATPVVPQGYTWRIYRTYVGGAWDRSLLHHVVEETSEASGIIAPTYADLGAGTAAGRPPSVSQIHPSPTKIDLEDSAEVAGRLPLSRVSAFPFYLEFTFDGALEVFVGQMVWVCEFPRATILGVRAVLGRGSVPASLPVIVDVNKGSGATPVFSSIFTDQTTRPKVWQGQQVGARAVPQVRGLVEGDLLTVDIDQAGGGATPTDRDLAVTIYGYAFGWTDPNSYDWP